MRPFLIIGLGGSGGKTIRYLKQSLREWLDEIGWEHDIPKAWQFLHIDTPETQDSPVLPGSPSLLPPNEYYSLHNDGIPFRTVVDSLRAKGESFDGWWVDPDYMNVPIAHGAGQYRAIGRVLGLDQQNGVLRQIRSKMTALRTTDAIGQMQGLRSAALPDEKTYQSDPDPVVMLISSLAGGTGAGLFMDIADMLRADGEQWLDNSFGILYAADVFRSLGAGAQAGIHPNAAAALAELLNGIYASGDVQGPQDQRLISRSGPAFPFLVGHANTSGVVFGDQTDVYRVMGRCLSAVMTDQKVQDDFVVYTAANWFASAGTFSDKGGPQYMLMEPPYVGALQGLGFAEVDLGVNRFKAYAERRIVRDAIETLVDGHRIRTYGQERYEGMTPAEISESIAEDRLTGFLDAVQINERGRETNQVIDAIALPEAERKRITGQLARTVYDGVTQQIGTKGRVEDWVDAVVEQTELLAPGANEQYDSRIRERARVWTEDVTERLLHETGELAAEYGLQVAQDLLGLVRSEISWVAEELQTEQDEFESLASHVRSNVQAAFGEVSGQLGSQHEAIGQGCASAVQTLVWYRMEEKARFIARGLLQDFDNGVVASLQEAVRLSLGDLTRKLEASDVEAAPVDGWPRHLPERDQAVPDDLIPGKTVAMVMDTESFPAQFDSLLTSTLGDAYETPHHRWRAVRHHVVTGDFLDGAEVSNRRLALQVQPLFETVDDWQPNEAILLGGEPERPARFRLHAERDELLLRARTWMQREGTDFDDFLSLGLRSYLQEPDHRVSPSEASQRELAFQSALSSAFDAAEPLVHVDRVLLSSIHGRTLRTHVVAGEIPLKNHRLERWVNEFLDDHVDVPPPDGHDNVIQDERVTRISIYSMLEGAMHPAVFRSVTDPIANGYSEAIRAGHLADFWKWRRGRPLGQAIPLPPAMVRALIRGWFIARFLGLLEVVSKEGRAVVRLSDSGQTLESSPLVGFPGDNKPRQLGSFLETLALGIPYAGGLGRPDEYLGIYGRLMEYGRSAGSVGAEVGEFNRLSPLLQEWVEQGTVNGSQPSVPSELRASGRDERAKALAELVTDVDRSYMQYADDERAAGRIGSENSWLGLAVLIHEELHRLARALESHISSDVPDF